MRSPPLSQNHELARPEWIAIVDHHQPSAGKRHAGDRCMGMTMPTRAALPRRLLLRGADHLLTMTDTPRPKTDLLIHQGRIEAIGPNLPAGDADVIDLSGHVLMPGFVDTHWHM
jgi:adenine deaminase